MFHFKSRAYSLCYFCLANRSRLVVKKLIYCGCFSFETSHRREYTPNLRSGWRAGIQTHIDIATLAAENGQYLPKLLSLTSCTVVMSLNRCTIYTTQQPANTGASTVQYHCIVYSHCTCTHLYNVTVKHDQ